MRSVKVCPPASKTIYSQCARHSYYNTGPIWQPCPRCVNSLSNSLAAIGTEQTCNSRNSRKSRYGYVTPVKLQESFTNAKTTNERCAPVRSGSSSSSLDLSNSAIATNIMHDLCGSREHPRRQAQTPSASLEKSQSHQIQASKLMSLKSKTRMPHVSENVVESENQINRANTKSSIRANAKKQKQQQVSMQRNILGEAQRSRSRKTIVGGNSSSRRRGGGNSHVLRRANLEREWSHRLNMSVANDNYVHNMVGRGPVSGFGAADGSAFIDNTSRQKRQHKDLCFTKARGVLECQHRFQLNPTCFCHGQGICSLERGAFCSRSRSRERRKSLELHRRCPH